MIELFYFQTTGKNNFLIDISGKDEARSAITQR
jgi:hypothetical protein